MKRDAAAQPARPSRGQTMVPVRSGYPAPQNE